MLRRCCLATLLLPTMAIAMDGSTAFCLFPLPADGGTQRFLNLGIVQYVEISKDAVIIAYGGGNLGSGHEARFPVKSREEANALLDRMRHAAAACMQTTPPAPPSPTEPRLP